MSEEVLSEVNPEEESKAEALEALKEAADKAPTNTEEAKAQIEAEKAKVEGKVKPDNIPEKFWDAEKGEVRTEELLKSYTELEKSKGQADETSETKAEDEATDKTEEKSKEETEDDVPPGKALVEELTTAYQENGEFTEEQYTKAAALGFDKEFVDQYAAGQEALAKEAESRIMTAAGGSQDELERVTTWASTALSNNERNEVNKAFDSGNTDTAVLAMEGLRARYEKATGTGGKLLQGKPAGSSVDGYKSQAEVTQAMSDPRYKSDPAYRQVVASKLVRSNYRR